MRSDTLLAPGRNCWRIARADRFALLVDGAAYFAAFADAVAAARASVLVLSWDIHSRVRLRRDGVDRDLPDTLAAFLSAALERREELHMHVLSWDPVFVYAFERETLLRVRMGWATHERLHFHLDDAYPPGGSLHQKVVVVDDRVAFSGGIDLASHRWDTPEHRPDDPRRVTPSGNRYRPFHDVQAAVSGPAAAALGDLARDRWLRATGEVLHAPPAIEGDPWPAWLEPSIRDLEVGIVRTEPEFDGRPAISETLALVLDGIAAARSTIYLEAQYLTSHAVRRALAERLVSDDAPEIVVVTAKDNEGWLEKTTMGALRARLVHELRAADRHDRLRVYHPVVAGVAPNVHSKLAVFDDELAYVGSANLSNRSLTIDHECGVAIEARGRKDVAAGLAGIRTRLLAEHLGADPEVLAAEVRERRSLIAAIEALNGDERGLVPLPIETAELTDSLAAIGSIADPERPISLGGLFDVLSGADELGRA